MDGPVDGRHQRRQQRRLARIEVAVVLDHVDGVPVRILDHFVDGVWLARGAHLLFDQRSDRTPPAAVVGAEERPPQNSAAPQLDLGPVEFLLELLAGEAFFLQGGPLFFQSAFYLRQAVFFQADLVDRIDRQDTAQHRADGDADQQKIYAPAELGAGIAILVARPPSAVRVFRHSRGRLCYIRLCYIMGIRSVIVHCRGGVCSRIE